MKRRRFIKIMAASVAGLSASGLLAKAGSGALREFRWNGYLMGAEGGFRLYGDNAARAEAVIERCFREIRRLERIFSLYDAESALCRLNRVGRLAHAPVELVEVLHACQRAHRDTGGGFDPTIQPLWKLYADHFAHQPDCAKGPSQTEIDACLKRIGLRQVGVDAAEIAFARPGMALTLNGVAQGYITDRVADILREEGFANVIVELGETRALGPKPDGQAWRLGVLDARQRDQLFDVVELQEQSLATSGGYGTYFDAAQRFHHLLDPRTGRPGSGCASVSVLAPTALRADALSTGFCLMPPAVVESLARRDASLGVLVQA